MRKLVACITILLYRTVFVPLTYIASFLFEVMYALACLPVECYLDGMISTRFSLALVTMILLLVVVVLSIIPFAAIGTLLFALLALIVVIIGDRPRFWAQDFLWMAQRGVAYPNGVEGKSTLTWRQRWARILPFGQAVRVVVLDSAWLSAVENSTVDAFWMLWKRIWTFLLLLAVGVLAVSLIEQTRLNAWQVLWPESTPLIPVAIASLAVLALVHLITLQNDAFYLNYSSILFPYAQLIAGGALVGSLLPRAIKVPVGWILSLFWHGVRPKACPLEDWPRNDKSNSRTERLLSTLLLIYGYTWIISSLPAMVAAYWLLRGWPSALGTGLAGVFVITALVLRSSRDAFIAYLAFFNQEVYHARESGTQQKPTRPRRIRGRRPDSPAGECFDAEECLWRPIHALMSERCSDLLDEVTLEEMGDGVACLPDQTTCNVMADRFEQWMEHYVRNCPSWDTPGVGVTETGRVVLVGESEKTQDVDRQPACYVAFHYFKEWIEFLRHCGGFEVPQLVLSEPVLPRLRSGWRKRADET